MSTKPAQLPSHPNHPTASGTKERQDPGLRELDERLRRASEKILPPSPYLLTVPTSKPFHLDAGQVEEWRKGTPFSAEEAHLQYMSFMPHWDSGLITPIGGWADEKGEMIDEEKEKRKSASATPQVGAKKMSLAEYKQRKPGMTTTNGTNGLPKANGQARNDAPASSTETVPASKDRKR